MDEFISIDKLIKQAKSKGVNFGAGDPYNRLRYYTKMGWLPHMVRKTDKKGEIKGHYPVSSIQTLLYIEELKSEGASNEEISKKLEFKNKKEEIAASLKSPELRKRIVMYTSLILLLLIFTSELGFINLGKPKGYVPQYYQNTSNRQQIYGNGTSFVPKNQKKIFVSFEDIKPNSKVYVTFTQNYSPATRYWVSKIESQSGFLLELDAPVSDNVEFNWWVSE
ncbi:MAG TPA: hypothetical protein PKH50_02275 [bacterium]|jgi:DNA-binding transcriptional MerR regulator|nr:hypothetical protein [bacterium]